MKAIDILIKYWGHSQFRLKQEEIIQQVLDKKDTLALLPTGGGEGIMLSNTCSYARRSMLSHISPYCFNA